VIRTSSSVGGRGSRPSYPILNGNALCYTKEKIAGKMPQRVAMIGNAQGTPACILAS
jgi:hypothetical protein